MASPNRAGRWVTSGLLLLAVVFAFLVPTLFESSFWLHLFDMMLINALMALGLNVKIGRASCRERV